MAPPMLPTPRTAEFDNVSQKWRMPVRSRECKLELENVHQNSRMFVRTRECQSELDNVSQKLRMRVRSRETHSGSHIDASHSRQPS
eukprot:15018908-Heterocapsa_arctica.AAC.1